MERIHNPCDHGIILWARDMEVIRQLRDPNTHSALFSWVKLLELPTVPTAENLAQYWYNEVFAGIATWGVRNNTPMHNVILDEIRVWETPNCVAWYNPTEGQ